MDRNSYLTNYHFTVILSLSARRAWIEIASGTLSDTSDVTSLSARRAWIEIIGTATALNTSRGSLSARRAWIEIFILLTMCILCRSLSARRAWIEIWHIHGFLRGLPVALRKESVDRNEGVIAIKEYSPWSLSARRAWIEIDVTAKTGLFTSSRSPQGERG